MKSFEEWRKEKGATSKQRSGSKLISYAEWKKESGAMPSNGSNVDIERLKERSDWDRDDYAKQREKEAETSAALQSYAGKYNDFAGGISAQRNDPRYSARQKYSAKQYQSREQYDNTMAVHAAIEKILADKKKDVDSAAKKSGSEGDLAISDTINAVTGNLAALKSSMQHDRERYMQFNTFDEKGKLDEEASKTKFDDYLEAAERLKRLSRARENTPAVNIGAHGTFTGETGYDSGYDQYRRQKRLEEDAAEQAALDAKWTEIQQSGKTVDEYYGQYPGFVARDGEVTADMGGEHRAMQRRDKNAAADQKLSQYASLAGTDDFKRYQYVAPVVEAEPFIGGKNAFGGGVDDTVDFNDYMSAEEKTLYHFINDTQGEDAANEYADLMRSSLENRYVKQQTAETAAYADEHPYLASVKSVGENIPKALAGGGYALQQFINNEDIDPNAAAFAPEIRLRTARDTVAEDMGGFGQFLYQTGMSVADFVTLLPFGQTASLSIMGAGAFQSSVRDATERGATLDQAIAIGAVAGAAEVITEKIGMDRLFKMAGSAKGSTLKQILREAVLNGFPEAGEEVITEIVDTLADVAILGSKGEWLSSYDALIDSGMNPQDAQNAVMNQIFSNVAMAGAGGLLSGAVMGGGAAGIGSLSQNIEYGKLLRDSDVTAEAVQSALDENAITDDRAALLLKNAGAKGIKGIVQDARMGATAFRTQDVINKDSNEENTDDPDYDGTVSGNEKQESQKNIEIDMRSTQALKAAAEKAARDSAGLPLSHDIPNNVQFLTQRIMDAESARTQSVPSIDQQSQARNETAIMPVATSDAGVLNSIPLRSETQVRLLEQTKGMDKATRDDMIRSYTHGQDVEQYASGFKYAEKAASSGMTYAAVKQSPTVSTLSPAQLAAAYNSGMSIEKTNTEKFASSLKPGLNRLYTDSAVTSAAEKIVRNSGTQYSKADVKKTARILRQQLAVIDGMTKEAGVKVVAQDRLDVADGSVVKISGANGAYNPNTKTLYISLDSIEGAYLFTATHELVHYIKDWNEAGFDSLQSIVEDKLGSDIFDARVKEYMDKHNISENIAIEEVVADSVPAILTDEEIVKDLVKKNRTLAERIYDFIKDFLDSISKMMDRVMVGHDKAEMLILSAESHDTLKEIYNAFDNALEATERPLEDGFAKGSKANGNVAAGIGGNDDNAQIKLSANGDAMPHLLGFLSISKETANNIKIRGERYVSSEEEILSAIDEAITSKKQESIHIGMIPSETLDHMEKELGRTVFTKKDKGEYTMRLSYDDFRHLQKHYSSASDILYAVRQVYDMLSSFDEIEYIPFKNGGGKIRIEKSFSDADYRAFEMVANQKRSLDLTTIFITKKRSQSVPPVSTMANAQRGSASNDIKPQTGEAVKDSPVPQAASSAKTSIKQIPALFKDKNVSFGRENIDIGGGKYDLATDYLSSIGTKNHVFDPYNRGEEVNTDTLAYLQSGKRADTATCANVLNVIAEPEARANVILQAAKSIKPDGKAYFMVYEGDRSGKGRETSAGWQNNRKTADYVKEIEKFFDNIERKGKLIVATSPSANLPKASWEVQPGKAILFSAKNSDGKNLTQEQAEYFKDSKARDASGNLLVVYHGGTVGNVFDTKRGKGETQYGPGAYFATGKNDAQIWANTRGGSVNEYYLNVANLFDDRGDIAKDANRDRLESLLLKEGFTDKQVKASFEWGFNRMAVVLDRINGVEEPKYFGGNIDRVNELIQEAGYDGIVGEFYDGAQYVIFSPERAKLTSNEKPSEGPDVRFSIKDDLPDVNTEELRDTMEYDDQADSVRAAAEITNGYKASDSVVDRIATATLRETMSTYDKDKLTAALREVFTNIGVASDEAFEYLTRVAKDILMKSSEIDRELSAKNKEIRSLVRNAKIRLTEVQRKNVEYAYGSYNAYRKQHGLFNVTDKGMYLDQLWASWSEAFPDVFDADMGEGDMPFAIREILTRYQDHYSNPYGFGMDESASYYAMRMLDQFFSTQEIKHFAGARATELKAITDKYEQRLKSVREQSRKRADERIAKIKAANRERLNLASREYAKAKKEQRQADREKFLDEYKKLTDSKDQKLAEQKERFNEWKRGDRAKRENKQESDKLKRRIADRAKELQKMLVSPKLKEGKYVPDFLREPVSGMLSGIDFTGPRGGIAAQDKWYASMTHLYNEYENYVKAHSGDSNIQGTVKNADSYMSTQLMIHDAFLPIFNELLENIKGKGDINRLSVPELQQLDIVLSSVYANIRDVNRLYRNKLYAEASNAGDAVISYAEQIREHKEWRFFNWAKRFAEIDMLDSFSYGLRLGKAGESIVDAIGGGLEKSYSRIREASEYFSKLKKDLNVSDAEISAWTKKVEKFTLSSGKTISISDAQMMELYALNNREQARLHLYKGGIEIAEIRTGTKAIDQKESYAVTEDDISKIIGSLSSKQRLLIDGMQDFMSTVVAGWGNETTQELYMVDMYREPRYWTIRASRNSIDAQKPEEMRTFNAVMNSSFTKPTNRYASNPITIGDAFQTFGDHISGMAVYNGLALPIDDAMKWLNYRQKDENGVVVRNGNTKLAIDKVLGDAGVQYLKNLITDLNGLNKSGYSTQISNKLLSNFKKASVSGKLRVVVQQPVSIFRALSEIDGKYLLAASFKQRSVEEMQKYSPIAWWKSQGNYEIGTGRSLRSVVIGDDTAYQKFSNFAMKPAGAADDITWSHIWEAVKLEVKAKNKDLDGDAYMNRVSERFAEIVNKTQVVDTIMHRSQAMRSQDVAIKQTTAFMSEPTKTYNMLVNAVYGVATASKETKGGAYKKLARTCVAWVLTEAAHSAIVALHDSFRDRDDEERFLDQWLSAFIKNIKGGMSLLDYIPYLRTVGSLIDGYDATNMETEALSEIVDAVTAWTNYFQGDGKKTRYGLISSSIKAISDLVGGPFGGLLASAETIINGIKPGTLKKKK